MRAKLRRAALGLGKDPSPLAAEARAGLRTSAFVAGHAEEFAGLQRMMESSRLASGK